MAATLIAGARLLDPATGMDAPGDLLLGDGVILDHGAGLGRPDGAEIVDADGLCLAPGLVDLRAALGEPGAEHRETIASAAQAAVADDPERSVIGEQVEMGVAVRMAVLDVLARDLKRNA